jgi:hypothetical protein
MSNEINLYRLGFKQDWKVLSFTLKNLPNATVEDHAGAIDLLQVVSQQKMGLVIASLAKKEDLIQIATFMKVYKKMAPETALKMVVVNFSGDKTYERAMARLGILDLIDPMVNAKALKFKIDFWVKGLAIQAKKMESALQNSRVVSGGSGPEESGDKGKAVDEPNWIDPLDCEDDVWLLTSKADCKRVLGKWLIKLKGPSPCVAQWVETNNRNIWHFEFKEEEKEGFISGGGEWYFRGEQKPDFIWKENLWLITGNQYDLFYKDGDNQLSRLNLRDKKLSICKNSEYAKTKEELIIASFDKEMVFSKNGVMNTNEEVDTEGGTDRFKNLEGKGKTDKHQHDPLQGKGGEADRFGSDPLAMDLEAGDNKIDNRMYGPAGENPRDGEELGLDVDNQNIEKYYKNKEAKSQDSTKNDQQYGPAGEQPRKGAELGLKNDNNKISKYYNTDSDELGEDDLGGHYKGAGSTDKFNEDDYGGKNQTDKLSKYYNTEDTDSKQNKKTRSEDLDNLSPLERDKLEKRAKKEAIEAQERELMKRKAKNEKSAREDENASSDNSKKNKKPVSETADDGAYGGKSSTDKLSSHYSNNLSNDEKKKDKKNGDEWSRVIEEAKQKKKKTRDEDAPRENKLFDKSGANNQDQYSDEQDSFAAPANLFGKGFDFDKKKAKKSKKDYVTEDNTVSIEERAKKKKELEALINQEQDDTPQLNEATESGEIVSILSQNNMYFQCTLDDYFDNTIIFATNTPGIDMSSEVALDLSFKYLKKVARLNFKGTVSSLDDDSEGTKYISIAIGEENVKSFESFMKLYQIRQKNIDFFIKKAKGL